MAERAVSPLVSVPPLQAIMNGVEAAASLFGSEEPGTDPFASLGAETAEPAPSSAPQSVADDMFFSNPSQGAEAFDFPPREESLYPHSAEYPSVPANSQNNITSANPQHAPSASDYSEHWAGNNMTSEYGDTHQSSYTGLPPATNYNTYSHATTYSPYNTYNPPATSAYTTHTSSTLAAQPSDTSYISQAEQQAPTPQQQYGTKPAPGPYDPPVAPSKYSAYSSGATGKGFSNENVSSMHSSASGTQFQHSSVSSVSSPYGPAAQYSSYLPSAPVQAPPTQMPSAPPPRAPSSTYQGVAPPAPPAIKATVTRPKISNAYDPPFIPSRRASRPTHNAYQSPPHPSEPPPQIHAMPGQSSMYNGSYDSLTSQAPYGHTHMDAPSTGEVTNYSQHYLAGSSRPQSKEIEEDARSGVTASDLGQPRLLQNPLDDSATSEAEEASLDADVQPIVSTTGQERSSANISRPSSVNSISSTRPPTRDQSSVRPVSDNVSPRSVPLPFSPPIETKELLEADNNPPVVNGNSSEHLPPQNHYVPLQASRRDLPPSTDPYVPRASYNANNYIPRTSSPLSVHARSTDAKKAVTSPYVNGATAPVPSVRSFGGHAPVPPLKAASLYSPDDQSSGLTASWSDGQLSAQDVHVKPTSAQYAPSPSLIGANDPLSRTSARAPVVAFGFGGKLITCFHGMPGLNAGFDVALSARTTSELKIHNVRKIIPESALNTPGASYPGPLFSDPATASISLVRSGQATQIKTKKAGVLAYLSGRASEIQQGLGYLSHTEKHMAENKLIIIKLLSVMVENDGRLLGNAQSDAAVRATLVPRLESLATGLQDGVSLQAAFHSAPMDEAPISVTTLRPSTLDKIEELLLQGERRQAYQFAADQKLWAHAMVIASSIDKESWKDVVNDFLRIELGPKEDAHHGPHNRSSHKSRDTLRVAYSLYSGQGVAAVQELAPLNLLQKATGRLQAPLAPPLPALTPRTPNFPPTQPSVSLPAESLAKWAETAAMIISSPLTPDTAAALTALGDQLLANDMTEAAHSCYLLSSQPSLFGGFGHPSARITLLGAKSPTEVMRNTDPLIFSEIFEFALSLIPTIKGQEPFHGLPHLQAYRLIRAVTLAETGDIQLANKYCEAIAASLGATSPYTTIALLEQLQGLQQRLSGVFHGDKSGSWITGKISKPSLDSIGGWLEGRFTKLVTGETDSPTPTADNARSNDQPFSGPFAHYSTISSTTPSARSSPQPMPPNVVGLPPPQRTSSAMATSSPYSQAPIERSSSAMGYTRQKPPVQIAKVNSGSISSSQSSPTGYSLNRHSQYSSESHPSKAEELTTPVQRASSWWDSVDDQAASNSTPTAATFMQVEESSVQARNDGFISLMDSHSYSIGPGAHQADHTHPTRSSSQYTIEEDVEDDLGLGNSKPKPKAEKAEEDESGREGKEEKPAAAAPAAAQSKETPSTGGSWFSRWWKKSDTASPGPVRANLGEESAFYYDKDLKRWVNKKSSGEETKPAAPPPPPPARAQTASPGMTGPKSHPPPPAAPPPRSASAIDLGAEPPMKPPMRIRSNLAPTESAPSTPTGSSMANAGDLPPPPSRPRSGAAKRNIRSRYVDVFQQEGGTPA